MEIIVTGNEWWDSLENEILSFQGIMTGRHDSLKRIAYALLADISGLGVVVSDAGEFGMDADLVLVNDATPDILGYDSVQDYINVVQSDPEFVHPEDQELVDAHIEFNKTGPYRSRLKNDNGNYQMIQTIGCTFRLGDTVFRVSIFQEAPD